MTDAWCIEEDDDDASGPGSGSAAWTGGGDARRPGRRPGRYTQAARVLSLYRLLARRRTGARLSELAAAFGISERQLRRDLEAIDAAAGPVLWDSDEEGRSLVWLRREGP